MHALAVALVLGRVRRGRVDRTTRAGPTDPWAVGVPPLDPPDATW
ncbi:MAG: hypothetical protein ACRYG2_13230 [Janthinobacterium lividum]